MRKNVNSSLVLPQNSMNLPPDKVRLLRQYDNEKKWELICDQVRESASMHSEPLYNHILIVL